MQSHQNLTRRYADEAVRVIREHKDQPFFLYLPHTMPHVPLFASDDFSGKSRRGLYARRALRAGERISESDVIALRPATSLGPADLPRLSHSTLSRDVAAGAPLRPEYIAIERAS